jgi:hypothetical protein
MSRGGKVVKTIGVVLAWITVAVIWRLLWTGTPLYIGILTDRLPGDSELL